MSQQSSGWEPSCAEGGNAFSSSVTPHRCGGRSRSFPQFTAMRRVRVFVREVRKLHEAKPSADFMGPLQILQDGKWYGIRRLEHSMLPMHVRSDRVIVQVGSRSTHILHCSPKQCHVTCVPTEMVCSKALLSCRSPVFERMFSGTPHGLFRKHLSLMHITGSFKEATSSAIALEDMDSDVAVMLIDWIQEDRCPHGEHGDKKRPWQ